MASDNICARPPTTWTVWIHRTHTTGGASSSITMVVVFVGCLCCCGLTRDFTSSSYVKNGTKITYDEVNDVTFRPTSTCTIPGGQRKCKINGVLNHARISWRAKVMESLAPLLNVPLKAKKEDHEVVQYQPPVAMYFCLSCFFMRFSG